MSTYVFTGKILTQNYKNKEESILISKDDKIIYVGNEKKLNFRKYELINLKEKLLLPAFIDSHIHFTAFLRDISNLDLKGVDNKKDLILKIKEHINKSKSKKIRAYSLDFSKFYDLDRYFLDSISEIPIMIMSSDYHTMLASSSLIKLSNIDSNFIEKYKTKLSFKDNQLSGYFFEDSYKKILDVFNEDDNIENLDIALKTLYKNGIVSIEEMAFSKKDFFFYDKYSLKNKLRVVRHFPENLLDYVSKNNIYEEKNWLKLGGLKVFYDGALSSKTALISKKYNDNNFGIRNKEKKYFEELFNKASKYNFGLLCHCIGDKACKEVIDIYSNIEKNSFFRIEHAQHLDNESIEKIEKLNIFLSMQAAHIESDIKNIKNIQGLDELSYRFKDISLKNILFALSSDSPIAKVNPFLGIYSALTHSSFSTHECLNQNQSLDIERILKAYTIDAAKLSSRDSEIGSLKEGKLADFIIIDDILNMSAKEILDAKVHTTFLNGKVVFEK